MKSRGRSKKESDFSPITSPSKPYKDYHASSSNDRKQSGDDRRKSTGSVREEVNPIKCKFYKSIGDESSVERREFEVWKGSIHEQIGPLDIYVL